MYDGHTYLVVLGQILVLDLETAPLNNKQKRSPNLQFIAPDRRLFNMLEVICKVSSEKDAEPRPVLGHMLTTGSADLFMESYKLEKKKRQGKQDFE